MTAIIDNLDTGDLVIETPTPKEVNIDYLKEAIVPVSLTNKTPQKIIIDTISLNFSVVAEGNPERDGVVTRKCGDILKANGTNYWNITVKPNLSFQEATNSYGVKVVYRKGEKDKLGDALTAIKPATFNYLIIGVPPATFGNVFISYKDEDISIAKSLQILAQRVGFNAYIAPLDHKPGIEVWEKKIVPAIQKSNFAFILWTDHTERDPGGVAREIELCRKFGVEEVLLILEDIDIPNFYETGIYKEKEYTRFRRENVISQFSDIVIARRMMIEG